MPIAVARPAQDLPQMSAAVMAHPARAGTARTVLSRLAPLPARLVLDPDPKGPPSTVRAARHAFAAVAPGATHHLVVQDDVRVPEGFAERVRRAVAKRPDDAVCLFVEWGSRTAMLARWAALLGAHWVPVINPYVPTQALVLPAQVSLELSRFMRDECALAEPDDHAVRRFLAAARVPAHVLVPNLVEHLDLPSLTGNTCHGARRSVCWLPHATPEFNDRVLRPPRLVPFLTWDSATAVVIDTASGTLDNALPTSEALRGWGCDETALTKAMSRALRALDCPRLTATVAPDRLAQLWLTSVAMGALVRRHWPAEASALAAGPDEAFAESLSTLAPGALRRHVDPDRLLAFRGALVGLLVDGMRAGARCVEPAAPDRPQWTEPG